MLRFVETKVVKENFYNKKKSVNHWDTNIDNIVFSK